MRSSILELLGTIGAGALVMGCGGSTEVHSLGNLPANGGATTTDSSITATSAGAGGGSNTTTSDGTVGGSGGSGGSAGMAALPDCATAPNERCQLVEGHDIRALAADDSRLYWVEYGTEDELGNHQYDGKIMAQDFDGGEPELVSTDLPAPLGLQLSESYFYVHAERWLDENGAETEALVRLPRAGGAAELVQAGLRSTAPDDNRCFHPCFSATPGYGYFYHRSGIHRVSEEPGAASSQLWADVEGEGFTASAGDDTVYFNTRPGGFQQLRFQAEATEPLLETVVPYVGWDADRLYWLEQTDTSTYLVRWQPGGGSPRRIAELESDVGVGGGPLKLADGHYFVSLHDTPEGTSTIVSGSLAEPERVTTRVEFPYTFDGGRYLSERWVGTPDAVYWIEEGAIFRAP